MRKRLGLLVLLAVTLGTAVPALAWQQTAEAAPDFAGRYNQGSSLMQQMRFREAVVEFREAVRLNPDHLPSHQALAVGYALTRNFPMAWKEIGWLRQAKVEMPPAFLTALSGEMSEKDALKKLQDVDKELADARSAQVRGSATSMKLAEALFKSGDYAAALQETDRVLRLDPNQPDAHFFLGELLGAEPQSSAQAVQHLKTYLQWASHGPENAEKAGLAFRIMGDLYNRGGDQTNALQAYEDGLKVLPKSAGMLNNAAWLYATATDRSMRNAEKALAYARKAVEISEGKEASYVDTLAQAYYVNGQLDLAIETEEKALALSPDNEFMAGQLKRFRDEKQKTTPPKP